MGMNRLASCISSRVSRYVAAGLMPLGLAIAAGTNAILPTQLLAQETTGGITILGGIEPEYRLAYSIDRNEPYSEDARYYLRVPGNKLPREVVELEITYPAKFEEMQGEINPNQIEVRTGTYRGDAALPIEDIVWDQANQRIEIFPVEPIPANTSLVIVLSDVHNPRRYGIHYFNLKLMYQGDVLRQYVGTWPLEVAAE